MHEKSTKTVHFYLFSRNSPFPSVRTLSPYPRLTFSATVFVGTEHFLPAFSPLPRAGLFILPFRPILIRTRRVNPPPNLPVKISRTLSACIFCTSCRSSRRTHYPPPSSSFSPDFRNVNVLFAAFAHRNALLKPLRRAPFDKQRKFTVFPLLRLPRPSSLTDFIFPPHCRAARFPCDFCGLYSAKPSRPMPFLPLAFFRSSPPHVFFPRPMFSTVRMRLLFSQFTARPPQRRFRAANLRSRTDDSRIEQKSRRQQPTAYLSASYAAPRRFFPQPHQTAQPKAQAKSA